MKSIEIVSGNFKGLFSLGYSFIQEINGDSPRRDVMNANSDGAVHQDLVDAFNNLIPHFALISEQITEKEAKKVIQKGFDTEEDHPLKQQFHINYFKIVGSGETEGVEIEGTRLLERGSSIKWKTPKVKWEDKHYKYCHDLSEAIETLKVEINEYINGKHAPSDQGNLFEGFVDDMRANGIEVTASAVESE